MLTFSLCIFYDRLLHMQCTYLHLIANVAIDELTALDDLDEEHPYYWWYV